MASAMSQQLSSTTASTPAMSLPVTGTLIVEPTETRTWPKRDRTIGAMIAIQRDTRSMGRKRNGIAVASSVLQHAPHGGSKPGGREWDRPRAREQSSLSRRAWTANYWPPSKPVGGAYGGRLLCIAARKGPLQAARREDQPHWGHRACPHAA